MKNICRYMICLFGLLLDISFSFHLQAAGNEKADFADIPDSIVTDDKVYEYTFSDFGKAQRIMARLRERKSLSYQLDVVEGDLYFNTGRYYQALKFYKNAFNNPSVQANDTLYMEQVHRLISCYDCLHNETKKAQYVDMLMKKAEQCGNKEMQSVAMFNMGKMLYYQGNKDKGYGYMQRAVDLMEQTDYKYKYDNLRYNYNTLLTFQELDRRNEEALRTLEALQKVVSGETGSETPMEGLDDKEKKAMFAHYAVVLLRLGRVRDAEESYKQFLSTAEEYDRDNYLIMPYLFDRRMYDQVIGMNSAREKILAAQGDTVTYHMTTIKKSLGRAYEEKGDYRTAARYFRELAVLRDSIKNREQKSSALELAALYETHEKDMLIQKQASDMHVRNIWLILAVGIILLSGIFSWWIFHCNRVVRRKNKAMVRTIEELLVNKEELHQKLGETLELRKKLEEQSGISPLEEQDDQCSLIEEEIEEEDAACHSREEVVEKGSERINDLHDKALFEKIAYEIVHQKLYLRPDFTREELVKIIYVPKNKFAFLFKQYGGMSFSKYITKLRLSYASKLLKEYPDYTVSSIAKECGIPVTQTFHRLFFENYGVTPKEFRENVNSVEN